MSNDKGDRRERELARKFDDAGWGVMRAPASGSATERELPDIFAGNGGVLYAFEAKAVGDGKVYIDKEKVEGLEWFAEQFGAIPRIALRYDREPWWFLDIGDLHDTGGQTYRGSLQRAEEHGLTWEQLQAEATA